MVCDRFFDSSLAYQGYGHRLEQAVLREVTRLATEGLRPDLTLLLDVPPEEGLRRRKQQSEQWNRLDAYRLSFHARVRQGFLALAEAEPRRWEVLDATEPSDAIFERVWARVQLAQRAQAK